VKLPNSDAHLEAVYDLVNRQSSEAKRAEVARIARLAAEHRARALAKTMKAAIPPGRNEDGHPTTK
jgi:hypothetical protein